LPVLSVEHDFALAAPTMPIMIWVTDDRNLFFHDQTADVIYHCVVSHACARGSGGAAKNARDEPGHSDVAGRCKSVPRDDRPAER